MTKEFMGHKGVIWIWFLRKNFELKFKISVIKKKAIKKLKDEIVISGN